MRWRVDGRTVQEQTEFRVGSKSERAKAEARLADRTEIFRLKHEQDQLAILIKRRETIGQRLKRLQDEAMPASRPLTLSRLDKEWRESPRRRDCSEAQLETYSRQLSAFVEWAGGGLDLRAVGDELAERYAKHLAAKCSPNTYNKHLNTLTAIWKVVGHSRGIENPWKDLPRKRLDTHVRRALTPEEIDQVIKAADGEWRALLIVGARTGLRLGDACRLKWSAFGPDGVLRVKTSKTGAAVALPGAELRAELEGIVGSSAGGELIMPSVAALYERNKSDVCSRVRHIFAAAGVNTSVKEKGWGKARPEATFHSLRHAFVTRAIESGVAPPIVRALVGHNTAAMTDRYTHIGEAAVLEAFKAVKI